MLKKTQLLIIEEKLKKTGIVSRNWALRRYISRLGALMNKLKNQGMKYSAGYTTGKKDYIYILRK